MKLFIWAPRIALVVLMFFGVKRAIDAYRWLPEVDLISVFPKEHFTAPVALRELPDRSAFVIVEKPGTIKWLPKNADRKSSVMLDMTDIVYSAGFEEGLLGFAFDPKFSENHYIYIFYSLEKPLRSRLSRLQLSPNLVADRQSELVILDIPKLAEWHNGGMLEFGPDNMLYISVGEGTIPERALADKILQSKESFYGTLLRIDVSAATKEEPYKIPNDNPFVGQADPIRKEIFAFGFRNIWHFSFDEKDKRIYANDVGGSRYEEVDVVVPGGHHGWPVVEGETCRYSSDHGNCDRSNKIVPIASMSHDVIVCITGGYANYADHVPSIKNHYVMSGFEDGLFAFQLPFQEGDVAANPRRIYPNRLVTGNVLDKDTLRITSLAQDSERKLYAVDYSGRIFRIVDRPNKFDLSLYSQLLWN